MSEGGGPSRQAGTSKGPKAAAAGSVPSADPTTPGSARHEATTNPAAGTLLPGTRAQGMASHPSPAAASPRRAGHARPADASQQQQPQQQQLGLLQALLQQQQQQQPPQQQQHYQLQQQQQQLLLHALAEREPSGPGALLHRLPGGLGTAGATAERSGLPAPLPQPQANTPLAGEAPPLALAMAGGGSVPGSTIAALLLQRLMQPLLATQGAGAQQHPHPHLQQQQQLAAVLAALGPGSVGRPDPTAAAAAAAAAVAMESGNAKSLPGPPMAGGLAASPAGSPARLANHTHTHSQGLGLGPDAAGGISGRRLAAVRTKAPSTAAAKGSSSAEGSPLHRDSPRHSGGRGLGKGRAAPDVRGEGEDDGSGSASRPPPSKRRRQAAASDAPSPSSGAMAGAGPGDGAGSGAGEGRFAPGRGAVSSPLDILAVAAAAAEERDRQQREEEAEAERERKSALEQRGREQQRERDEQALDRQAREQQLLQLQLWAQLQQRPVMRPDLSAALLAAATGRAQADVPAAAAPTGPAVTADVSGSHTLPASLAGAVALEAGEPASMPPGAPGVPSTGNAAAAAATATAAPSAAAASTPQRQGVLSVLEQLHQATEAGRAQARAAQRAEAGPVFDAGGSPVHDSPLRRLHEQQSAAHQQQQEQNRMAEQQQQQQQQREQPQEQMLPLQNLLFRLHAQQQQRHQREQQQRHQQQQLEAVVQEQQRQRAELAEGLLERLRQRTAMQQLMRLAPVSDAAPATATAHLANPAHALTASESPSGRAAGVAAGGGVQRPDLATGAAGAAFGAGAAGASPAASQPATPGGHAQPGQDVKSAPSQGLVEWMQAGQVGQHKSQEAVAVSGGSGPLGLVGSAAPAPAQQPVKVEPFATRPLQQALQHRLSVDSQRGEAGGGFPVERQVADQQQQQQQQQEDLGRHRHAVQATSASGPKGTAQQGATGASASAGPAAAVGAGPGISARASLPGPPRVKQQGEAAAQRPAGQEAAPQLPGAAAAAAQATAPNVARYGPGAPAEPAAAAAAADTRQALGPGPVLEELLRRVVEQQQQKQEQDPGQQPAPQGAGEYAEAGYAAEAQVLQRLPAPIFVTVAATAQKRGRGAQGPGQSADSGPSSTASEASARTAQAASAPPQQPHPPQQQQQQAPQAAHAEEQSFDPSAAEPGAGEQQQQQQAVEGAAAGGGAASLPAGHSRVQTLAGFAVKLRSDMRCEVVGVFHPQLYMENADCVEYPVGSGRFVSRSHFEKIGGALTAKWYRSIRVLPDLEHLGDWLEKQGLPVFKGCVRRRFQKPGGRGGAGSDGGGSGTAPGESYAEHLGTHSGGAAAMAGHLPPARLLPLPLPLHVGQLHPHALPHGPLDPGHPRPLPLPLHGHSVQYAAAAVHPDRAVASQLGLGGAAAGGGVLWATGGPGVAPPSAVMTQAVVSESPGRAVPGGVGQIHGSGVEQEAGAGAAALRQGREGRGGEEAGLHEDRQQQLQHERGQGRGSEQAHGSPASSVEGAGRYHLASRPGEAGLHAGLPKSRMGTGGGSGTPHAGVLLGPGLGAHPPGVRLTPVTPHLVAQRQAAWSAHGTPYGYVMHPSRDPHHAHGPQEAQLQQGRGRAEGPEQQLLLQRHVFEAREGPWGRGVAATGRPTAHDAAVAETDGGVTGSLVGSGRRAAGSGSVGSGSTGPGHAFVGQAQALAPARTASGSGSDGEGTARGRGGGAGRAAAWERTGGDRPAGGEVKGGSEASGGGAVAGEASEGRGPTPAHSQERHGTPSITRRSSMDRAGSSGQPHPHPHLHAHPLHMMSPYGPFTPVAYGHQPGRLSPAAGAAPGSEPRVHRWTPGHPLPPGYHPAAPHGVVQSPYYAVRQRAPGQWRPPPGAVLAVPPGAAWPPPGALPPSGLRRVAGSPGMAGPAAAITAAAAAAAAAAGGGAAPPAGVGPEGVHGSALRVEEEPGGAFPCLPYGLGAGRPRLLTHGSGVAAALAAAAAAAGGRAWGGEAGGEGEGGGEGGGHLAEGAGEAGDGEGGTGLRAEGTGRSGTGQPYGGQAPRFLVHRPMGRPAGPGPDSDPLPHQHARPYPHSHPYAHYWVPGPYPLHGRRYVAAGSTAEREAAGGEQAGEGHRHVAGGHVGWQAAAARGGLSGAMAASQEEEQQYGVEGAGEGAFGAEGGGGAGAEPKRQRTR